MKDDFMRTGKQNADESAIDPRVLILQQTPLFKAIPEFFGRIAPSFNFRQYEKNEIILQGNKPIDRICFVIQGECKVTQLLPLLQHKKYGHHKEEAFEGKREEFVETDECQIIDVEVVTQEENLTVGNWFPYIPVSLKHMEEKVISKQNIYIYRYKNPSECQIRADSKVLIAYINFEDFVDICLEKTLMAFLDHQDVKRYPLDMLQKQYLQEAAWNTHKKHVVSDVVEAKIIRRGTRR